MQILTFEGPNAAMWVKKATERIYFTCSDGGAINATIEKAIATGEGQVFEATSIGKIADGQVVTDIKVTWGFKVKGR